MIAKQNNTKKLKISNRMLKYFGASNDLFFKNKKKQTLDITEQVELIVITFLSIILSFDHIDKHLDDFFE